MLSAAILAKSPTCLQWLVSLLLHVSRSKVKQVCNMITIKKFGFVVAAALMIVVAIAPTFALPASAASANPYDQQILQARYDYVSARVGFMTGVLSDTASLVANASDLNTNVRALDNDLDTLKGYVNANDKAGFDNCVKATIHTDMQAAVDALKADRQQFKEWGVTAATKQQLLSDYQSRKVACESQTNSATVEMGGVKLQYYNDVMSKADSGIATLSSKGVDVSGMQAAESGARTNVIAPLQSAVSSGDAGAVKSELTGKCLGNGAPYSYHYFAQSDLAKLNALTEKIADNATAAGHGDQISDVNARLSAAQGALSAAGTSPYSGDQKDTVWNNLKAASGELKTIIQELQGGQSNQG